MAENTKTQYYAEGALPVDLRGKEAWTGGAMLPVGKYRMQLMGFGQGKSNEGNSPSCIAHCKVLAAEDESLIGRDFDEYFAMNTDGEKPAINFFVGFIDQLVPGGYLNDPAKCVQGQNGMIQPDMRWVTGGKGGTGAVFDCAIHEHKVPKRNDPKTGKEIPERTINRLDRGSVELAQPSSFYTAQRGQAANAATPAGNGQQAQPAAPWGNQTPAG